MTKLLVLGLALTLHSGVRAEGVRRGSYGARHVSGYQVGGTGGYAVKPVSNGNSGGTVSASKFWAQEEAATDSKGYAPVRGRGMVGYGSVNSYNGRTAGYSRGLSGSRGYGSMGRGFTGGTRRAYGTRYADAPGGDTQTPTTSQEPVQGFAVPGALIRTAGLEHYYNEPSQPQREFAIAAGRPQIQDNLAYNETNHKTVYQIPPDKAPNPNPGWGSSGAGGGNSITPNTGPTLNGSGWMTGGGSGGAGSKPNDPSDWNDNKGGGNGNGNGNGGGR